MSAPRAHGDAADAAAATEVVELEGVTHGGEAVGRLASGKVCFVPYAIPGERVTVTVVEERRRWARGRLVEVLDASPDRRDPPCPYFGVEQPDAPPRCGGCQLQHVTPRAQARLKQRIVTETLQRLGGIADPPVEATVAVADFGYRMHARFGVDEAGRLGFRRPASRATVPIDRCLIAAPGVQALREEAGDAWTGVEEVTVRAASRTGSRALLVRPGASALPPLPAGDAPVALLDETGRAAALRGEPTVVEHVAGFPFRISPTSFFQPSAAGAETLAGLVREAAAVGEGEAALDLYAGVGLFARVLAADGAAVVAVEAHPDACDDARANLADTGARVLCADVDVTVARAAAGEPLTAGDPAGQAFEGVVLDPPRRGAGPAVCRALARLRPRVVVYVACDPAALARDARILVDGGFRLERAVPVDQFAQTAHIETVAVFHGR